MRKLMGVFHLDPFTMLNGVGGSPRAWQYGPGAEVGSLEEGTIMFECQLELDHPLVQKTPTGSRGSSPSYSKDESTGASYRGSYFHRYNDAQKSDIDSGSSNCSQYGVGAAEPKRSSRRTSPFKFHRGRYRSPRISQACHTPKHSRIPPITDTKRLRSTAADFHTHIHRRQRREVTYRATRAWGGVGRCPKVLN
ncbi:hypothetical protein BD410DRAFT_627296 [Rickenella mellea]|uniref:Uncharacterized protein n=1 Tax=Rickenella mellea TaxID=50990 RepID=A0A4Y7QD04_9AGAM|nr:hypothetical protein BD410DRAFT_627296 [Rickenella mellea]